MAEHRPFNPLVVGSSPTRGTPGRDRLAAAAMSGGALAAKLAGAGQGGTVLAVTFDKERTVKALLDAGATRILYPKPGPGLTITVDA